MPFVSDKQRRAMLQWTGIRLAKDGKSVFNYNPGLFQSGFNFVLAFFLLPSFLNRGHFIQLAVLYVMMWTIWFLDTEGPLDELIPACFAGVASMSRFVLGLFVSLVLSKTYYSNRGMFGTVFGCSMGLAQMVVAWVKPPPALEGNEAAIASAKAARLLLIRWINAGFRLMWLETLPGKSPGDIGKDLMAENLLTQKEWSKIEGLSSRCTHVYQWMNNLLEKLFRKGYILSGSQLVQMNTQVDNMRGANVWGLPSLPITYTQLITHMVKMHLIMLALNNGVSGKKQGGSIPAIIIEHGDLAFHNYLFQGLLDLHGALYNPNAGIYLGHMPACNFMAFVRDVTNKMESENEEEQYEFELVGGSGPQEPSIGSPVKSRWSERNPQAALEISQMTISKEITMSLACEDTRSTPAKCIGTI